MFIKMKFDETEITHNVFKKRHNFTRCPAMRQMELETNKK